MDKEKHLDFETDADEAENEQGAESAPRARNRTVLLTPEITGQVRARLAQQSDEERRGPPVAGGFDQRAQPGGFTAPPRPGGVAGGMSRPGSPFVPADMRESPSPVRPGAAVHQALDKDAVVWSRPSKIIGCLVSFDVDGNGELFVLRAGRLVITSSQPPGGSYLYIKDDTVSMMHAVLRVTEEGEIQLLDQLSEHGTGVQRFNSSEEVSLSGDKCAVGHGDIVKFGNRSFHVCLLAKNDEEAK